MDFVTHLNILGVESKEIPCIVGSGAPTTATEGEVGCFYMDRDTGKVYKCTAANSGAYTWALFGDGKDGEDGYTPVKGEDYYTDAEKTEWIAFINAELAKKGQVDVAIANSIDEMTDPAKLYVYNGYIYQCRLTEVEVEGEPDYINVLPSAEKGSDQNTYWQEGKGYATTTRLSGSGGNAVDGSVACSSGYIPCKVDDVIRIKNFYAPQGVSCYVISYNSSKTRITNKAFQPRNSDTLAWPSYDFYTVEGDQTLEGITTFTLTEANFGSGIAYIRFSGIIDENTIVTIGKEIKNSTITTTDYAWVNTGVPFVADGNEDRIAALETLTAEHSEKIGELRELINSGGGSSGTGNNGGSGSTTSGPTNVLATAINADGTPYVGDYGEKGYKVNCRLNSSRVEKPDTPDRCCTGFIPVKYNDTVRIKNIYKPVDGNGNGYIHFYGADFTTNTGMAYEYSSDTAIYIFTGEEIEFKPCEVTKFGGDNRNATEATAYMRISTGIIDESSIITINAEIVENPGGGNGSGGSNDTPPMSDEEKLAHIRYWDAPIYDANIPVFQLSAEKAAMTNAADTPAALYALYDALMAQHPHYITKTDLGLCSDGVNHVYRYDFKEPASRYTSGYDHSETKAKAIIVAGIHYEWAGMYGLYYALEEIANNPELYHLRRNTHLIVVPCMNPYCTLSANYTDSIGVLNANGVQIHRNFEVGFLYPDNKYYVEAGERNHGGTAPLSEVETQYVDTIMRGNTDAAFFLTCHSFGDKSFNFIWPSTATAYTCNMGYRLIEKLSRVWLDKYGAEFIGLEEYRTEDIPSWDNRLGFAHISSTPGTETRQATKYGIQSANVEINGRFWVHGTESNREPSNSSFTMSRGAEVYVNYLLMMFGCYDPKDKALYYIE